MKSYTAARANFLVDTTYIHERAKVQSCHESSFILRKFDTGKTSFHKHHVKLITKTYKICKYLTKLS